MSVPVLLVHGIFDTGDSLGPMRAALLGAGVRRVATVDLEPNDGSAKVAELGRQVELGAQALLKEAGATRLDVVGFSMGALVTRFWMQRLGGKGQVRRFVSISGPHRGTVSAWFVPRAGVRDMRPNSALLQDLASDPDPWGDAEVHCFWTPYDLMILPAKSSVVPHAHGVHKFFVALHRWMVTDARVLDAVACVLTG